MTYRCSIIGSFRKYYEDVVDIITFFEDNSIIALSPKKSNIINPDDEFVLFLSDDPSYSDYEIQLIALNRILHSDFVYVCNPGGYIGRTTAYEIGRIVERQIPLFFQEPPLDIPIFLHDGAILSKEDLVESLIGDSCFLQKISYDKSTPFSIKLNENLFSANYYEQD